MPRDRVISARDIGRQYSEETSQTSQISADSGRGITGVGFEFFDVGASFSAAKSQPPLPSTGPSSRQVGEVNRLVRDRTTSTIDALALLATNPRIEQPSPVGTLTLRDAVDRTLMHNLSLVASAENLSIAQVQLAQAGLFQNPNIGQTGAFYFPLSAQSAAVAFDVAISQTLNTFFTRPYKVAAAKAQRFQAGIDIAAQAFDLAQQAAGKYGEMAHLLRNRKLAVKIASS